MFTPFQPIPLGVRFRQFADPTAIEYTPDGNAVQPPKMGIMMSRTNPKLIARGWAYYVRNAMSLKPVSLSYVATQAAMSLIMRYMEIFPDCVGISASTQEAFPGSGIPKRFFIYGNHPAWQDGKESKKYAMMFTIGGPSEDKMVATVRGVTENPVWTEFGVPTPSRLIGLWGGA